jgi:hypothetical protein
MSRSSNLRNSRISWALLIALPGLTLEDELDCKKTALMMMIMITAQAATIARESMGRRTILAQIRSLMDDRATRVVRRETR